MRLLPKWVLTMKNPAFYDMESATAIEQTAKLYGAMNELITEYNTFADSVNKQAEEFMNSAGNDYEVFRVALRQEFQDFINVVDLKLEDFEKTVEGDFSDLIIPYIDKIETETLASFNELANTKLEQLMFEVNNEFALLREGINADFTAFKQGIETEMDEYRQSVSANIGAFKQLMMDNLNEQKEEVNNEIVTLEQLANTVETRYKTLARKLLACLSSIRGANEAVRKDICSVIDIGEDNAYISIQLRNPTARSIRIMLTDDTTKFEVYRISGYGYTRGRLYSTTSADKTLLKVYIDGVEYPNFDVLLNKGYEFRSIIYMYEVMLADSTVVRVTHIISSSGFSIIETMPTEHISELATGLITGSYVTPLWDQGEHIRVFTNDGSSGKPMIEKISVDGNTCIREFTNGGYM